MSKAGAIKAGATQAVQMDIPKNLTKIEVRDIMLNLQEKMLNHPEVIMGGTPECDNKFCPLFHKFATGCYIRQITMPKGMLLVSKIHKTKHPYFILKGDVSVLTEQGVVRLTAPYSGITEAGTKRVLYMHETTIWTTVHLNPTNTRDVNVIEKEIIATDFDELDNIHPAIGEVK